MLSVAFAARLDGKGTCTEARLVVSALAAKPRTIAGLEGLRGRPLDEAAIRVLAETAHKQCHAMTNIPYDSDYRRDMVPVFVRRAVAEALERTR